MAYRLTYRRVVAGVVLVASLAAYDGCTQTEGTYCPAPTEDSPITCNLDPTARYEYEDGVWSRVPDTYRHPNGNRPPTGAELLDME